MDGDNAWNVLLVDDEDDVHLVTRLALKKRAFRGRKFELTSARSGAQARELLSKPDGPRFQVAVVDVVMETPTAGLELCNFIRREMPRSLRIVLRTGQAGAAPEAKVLNDYDIDYYMAKAEVTEDRLFAVFRACIRSSLDLETMAQLGEALSQFSRVYEQAGDSQALIGAMAAPLAFLRIKHGIELAFAAEANASATLVASADPDVGDRLRRLVTDLVAAVEGDSEELVAQTVGEQAVFIPVRNGDLATSSAAPGPTKPGMLGRLSRIFGGSPGQTATAAGWGGFYVELPEELPPCQRDELVYDLRMLGTSWQTARRTLRMQESLLAQAAGIRGVTGV